MERKKVRLDFIENKYSELIRVTKEGNVYICWFEDGTCILINNKGKDRAFKFIMYNPESYGVTRAEISEVELKMFYNKILKKIGKKHCVIEENGDDMIEQFPSLANALFALEKGVYKQYRVRKLG